MRKLCSRIGLMLLLVGPGFASDVRPQVEVMAQFVEFPAEGINAVAGQNLGIPLGIPQLQKMIESGVGQLLFQPRVLTKTGSTAIVSAVKQCEFPTEFQVRRFQHFGEEADAPENVFLEPAGFETKEVGITLEMMPVLSPDNTKVSVRFRAKIVSEPTWEEHTAEYLQKDEPPVTLRFKRPVFHTREVATGIDLVSGIPVIVGGGMPNREQDKVAFLLLTCRLLDARGKAVVACGAGRYAQTGEWEDDGRFHQLIAEADRIVVRDGGFDCCIPTDGQKEFVVIRDPAAIRAFNQGIQFVRKQDPGFCLCCGYPGIDWYKGDRRLALTSVQHGTAIRWKGFPGDVGLTAESSEWLINWCLQHGISGQFDEFKKWKEKHDQGTAKQ